MSLSKAVGWIPPPNGLADADGVAAPRGGGSSTASPAVSLVVGGRILNHFGHGMDVLAKPKAETFAVERVNEDGLARGHETATQVGV